MSERKSMLWCHFHTETLWNECVRLWTLDWTLQTVVCCSFWYATESQKAFYSSPFYASLVFVVPISSPHYNNSSHLWAMLCKIAPSSETNEIKNHYQHTSGLVNHIVRAKSTVTPTVSIYSSYLACLPYKHAKWKCAIAHIWQTQSWVRAISRSAANCL